MPATPIPVRDDAPLSRPPAPCISVDASALDAIGLFQARPQLRLVAVVDGEHRPVGAVQEIDVRRILFNPFGHALLRNPSYSTSLDLLLSPCPVIEADRSLAELLDAHAARRNGEGLIVTRRGRYADTFDNHDMLLLAARSEVAAAQSQARRAERLQMAGDAFTRDVGTLAANLADVAGQVQAMAGTLSSRATDTRGGASSVATAAQQTMRALAQVAEVAWGSPKRSSASPSTPHSRGGFAATRACASTKRDNASRRSRKARRRSTRCSH